MKNIFLTVILLLFAKITFAQNDVDALRYSTLNNFGTTRNISMGGIFGVVGGDISCLSSNPGGMGRFSSAEFNISPFFGFKSAQSTYLNNSTSDRDFKLELGGAGIVFSPDRLKEGKGNLSFGLAINKQASYNEDIFISGYNEKNSLLNHYANELQGQDVYNAENNYPFDASLAFLAELIQVDTPNALYYTPIVQNGFVRQDITIQRIGGLDEVVIGGGGSIKDIVYIGASFGIPLLNYTENYLYRETDEQDSTQGFNFFTQENYVNTDGYGFNFKTGIIISPQKNVRIGVAIHSPTMIKMDDSYITYLDADFTTFTYNNESPEGAFSYKLVTPWKLLTGLSFLHEKFGLIGVEYELSDPSKSKYKFSDNDPSSKILESQINDNIAQKYQATHKIKVGLETKLKNWRFRGGVQANSTPFSEFYQTEENKKFSFVYSGGVGYRWEKFYVDAAYMRSKSNTTLVPYLLPSGEEPVSNIEQVKQGVSFTVGYKFIR